MQRAPSPFVVRCNNNPSTLREKTDACCKPILLQPLAQKHDKVLICGITFSYHIVIYCYFAAKTQININIMLYHCYFEMA